jgi:beta-lactamase regulating signal transducer with metallopeptidase domain
MMLAWVIDLLLVSGLLGLAALLLERILRSRHGVTRIPWLMAMLASLLVPFLSSSGHQLAASDVIEPTVGIDAQEIHSSPATSWTRLGPAPNRATDRAIGEALIIWLWAGSSALTGAILAGGMLQLRRQRHTWQHGIVAGVHVLVAPAAGPAVFGVFRPQIVVPEWLVNAPEETQRYVMAHELAHLQAHDSKLLALSALVVLLAPWNPLLWWQSRRLRMAIEVDCDRRVLGSGFNLKRYAEVLIEFGLTRTSLPAATTPISETPSTLERRIQLMFQPKINRWTLSSAALALVSIGAFAAATRFSPPPLMLAAATAIGEAHPLDGYVGSYEFASVTVLDIRRLHDKLSAVVPGQSANLLEQQPDQFRYEDADVTIRFERGAAGLVTGLRFEQNGAVTYAPRIGPARVQAIQSQIAERYRQQLASANSEKTLRALIQGLQSGAPDYSMMSAQLAGGTRGMLKDFQSALGPYGPIEAIEFKGVSQAGWDQYHVKHAHGASEWQIALDEKGIIVGALVSSDS